MKKRRIIFKRFSRRQRFIVLFCLFLILIPVVLYTFIFRKDPQAAWWNDQWSYRKAIPITNAGSNLTDYQVPIIIDTAALITAGKLQSDCNDMRITDTSGNLLPYWIEGGSPGCNNSGTEIWIKLSSVPTSGTSVYFYYGNPSAINSEDPQKVFQLFDDFRSVDTTKWKDTTGTNSIVAEGYDAKALDTSADDNDIRLYSSSTFESGYAVKARTKENGTDGGLFFDVTNSANGYLITSRRAGGTGAFQWYKRESDTWTSVSENASVGSWTSNEFRTLEIKRVGTSIAVKDNESAISYTTSTDSTYSSGSVGVRGSAEQTIDWILVRKAASTEPVVGSLGTEEISPAPVAYFNFDEGQGIIAHNTVWRKNSTTTNLIINPSMETDTTGWTGVSNGNGSITRSTSHAASGTYSVQLSASTGTETDMRATFNWSPNTTYIISTWIYLVDSAGTSPYIFAFDGTNSSYQPINTNLTNQWQRVSMQFTSSASPSNNYIDIPRVDSALSGILNLFIDGIQIEQGSSLSGYCDGSLTGFGNYSWTGTPHASTSTCSRASDADIIAPQWQTENMCISGKCLLLKGPGYYLNLNDTLDLSGNFTFESWIKLTSINSSWNDIFTGLGDDIRIGYRGDTHNFQISKKNVSDGPTSNTSVTTDNWVHVAVTFNNTSKQVNFYLNGKPDGGGTFNVSFTSGPKFIAYTDNPMTGFIDETKVFSYIRSGNEIKSDYNAGNANVPSEKGAGVTLGSNKDSSNTLSNGLIGYWKMDEDSWNGTTGEVADSSGNNLHGTSINSTTTTSGKFGKGGSFDGTNNYVDATNVPGNLNGNSEITIAAWAKLSGALDSNYRWIIRKSAGSYPYFFGVNSNNKLVLTINDQGYTLGINMVDDTNWHHLVGVFKNGTIYYYIDGNPAGSHATTQTSVTDTTGTITIGGWLTNGQRWKGLIDELRVYNRALSPSEVSQLYSWAPGPVAYWEMDENTGTDIKDSSGNGVNGNTSNTTWATGKFGSAIFFDNASDQVTVPHQNVLNLTSAMTFSGWIYPTVLGGNQIILYKGGGNWNGYQFVLWSNLGRIDMRARTGDCSTTTIDHDFNTGGIPINTWTHLAVTYDASINSNNYKIYNNGKLVDQGTLTGNLCPVSDNLYFHSGGEPFYGKMDEYRLYNYARTQKQIVEDMNAGHPINNAPIGYWKFDEKFGNTLHNSGSIGTGGDLNFASSPNNPTISKSGKVSSALSIDGDNDYAIVTNSGFNLGTGSYSVFTWVKTASTSPPHDIIIYNGAASVGDAGYWFGTADNGHLELFVNNGSSWIFQGVTGNTSIVDGLWHYVGFTWNPSIGAKFYLDGKLDGTNYATTTSNIQGSGTVSVGGISCCSGFSFNGLIDELKIYNSALTEEEIKQAMNQGSSITLGAISTDTSGKPDYSSSREYCPPGDIEGNCANGQDPNPSLEWKMDENLGSSVRDTSGKGTDASFGSGIANPSWSVGKFGAGLKFSGDDYIYTNSAQLWESGNSQPITWEGWFKLNDLSGTQTIIFKESQFRTYVNSSGYLICAIWNGDSGWESVTSLQTISVNIWYYFSCVTDDRTYPGVLRMYINGYPSNTAQIYQYQVQNFDTPVYLGQKGDSTEYLNGFLDNFKMYSYRRSASQVAWDFNRGGPVGWWKLDECQGGALNDAAGNGFTGTWNGSGGGTQTSVGTCTTAGTAWGNGASGKYSSSLNFDGTDDFVEVADNIALAPQTFTLSTWIKWDGVRYTAASGKDWSTVIAKGNYSSGEYTILVSRDSASINNQINVYINAINVVSFTPTLDTNWHLLTVVYNGSQVKIYLDGVYKNQGNFSNSIIHLSDTVRFGSQYNGSYPWGGQLDDIKIFNYPLNSTQIKTLFNEGSTVRY